MFDLQVDGPTVVEMAVRVSKDLRAAIGGARGYFASHPKPKHPRDLLNHTCVNFRRRSRGVYRWEFEKGRQSVVVTVDGPLIVDDAEIQVRAALDGIGVVWTLEHYATPFIAAGKLVRVLEDWCPRSQATSSTIRADSSRPRFQR